MSLVRVLCRSLAYVTRPAPPVVRTSCVWQNLLRKGYCSVSGKDWDDVEEGEECEYEDEDVDEEDEDEDVDLLDENYEQFVPRNLRLTNSPHNLLVIQPKVKYGHEKTKLMRRTTPELQLEEACTLVHSLEGWKVAHSVIIGTTSLNKRLVFGPGNNESIAEFVAQNKAVSGIFLSVNMMQGHKQGELEKIFGVPVFDRFSIVLQIFRERARTKEAKLQLALAEIPYVRSRLKEATRSGKEEIAGSRDWFGSGDAVLEDRIQILKDRERKIKRMIADLKVGRQVIRNQRQKKKIPTVAVVGYTNSGKTSLIKALTGSGRLLPQDKLFATVDVRLFAGRLQRLSHVLYIDTIGFISDIPSGLIESFKSTLEEVNLSDLIIHVQDVSHPDLKNQRVTVYATLKDMDVSKKLLTTMTEVGNKMDKLTDADACREAEKSVDLMVSATQAVNLPDLKQEVEKRLLVNMGCFLSRVRVSNGGQEYMWLLRNAIIVDMHVDDADQNFVFMDLRLTEAVAGKFRRSFGTSCFIRKRDVDPQTLCTQACNQVP